MQFIISVFDYIFYRAYNFGLGRSKVPIVYASMIVSILQALILITFVSAITLFMDIYLPPVAINVAFILLAYILNYFRYERNPWIQIMVDKWKQESKTKSLIKGWFIVLSIVLFLITPLVIAKIWYETHTK